MMVSEELFAVLNAAVTPAPSHGLSPSTSTVSPQMSFRKPEAVTSPAGHS